jgi:hypothetical protein
MLRGSSQVCGLRFSRARIGRWKDAVSIAQRARKKRYCRRMGWVERRFVGRVEAVVEIEVDGKVVLLVLVAVRLDTKGGGGVSGSDGDDEGVAFSMRAQVR